MEEAWVMFEPILETWRCADGMFQDWCQGVASDRTLLEIYNSRCTSQRIAVMSRLLGREERYLYDFR